MISMLGNGKSSLGQDLFRSLKFVHIMIPLVGLVTGTRLEIHSHNLWDE